MPQGMPQCGERYLHFKNKMYQIVTIANHSETGETMVVYQALYGDFGVYVRPLSMFISEVDHEKYPQVTQKYRFTLVEKPTETEQEATGEETDKDSGAIMQQRNLEIPAEEKKPIQQKDITELLMEFYDARTYEEKYNILLLMKDDITDIMINNMAVVLDIVIAEGNLDDRYEELKHCLRTYQKYEIRNGHKKY